MVEISINLMDDYLRMLPHDLSDIAFEVIGHTTLEYLLAVFGRDYYVVTNVEYAVALAVVDHGLIIPLRG